MSPIREGLLARIATYCETHAISERQFSLLVSGHTNAIARLRAGRATLRTIEAVERLLADPAPSTEPEGIAA